LSGACFSKRLEEKKTLARQQILQVLEGVCGGLQAAHENGLVHRDLKPENIFLAKSVQGEMANILDFGLVKFLASLADSLSATVGTVTAIGRALTAKRNRVIQKTWQRLRFTRGKKCSDYFGHSNCVFLRESTKVVIRRFHL